MGIKKAAVFSQIFNFISFLQKIIVTIFWRFLFFFPAVRLIIKDNRGSILPETRKNRAERRKECFKMNKKLAAGFMAFTMLFTTGIPFLSNEYTTKAYAAGGLLVPTSPGTVTYGNEKAVIDASNASKGYITVKYLGDKAKIKVQVTKAGAKTYTYNISARGVYEVFPLTSGNGTYTVNVYENVKDSAYALAYGSNIEVALESEFSPFLYPNQYVNFSAASTAVAVSQSLAGASDLETVQNVYNFVIDNITYDTQKAATVQSGYLPSADMTLATKTGICFDYAALMTAMLRSQGIPTKLVIGYTGSVYHAWINAYIDEIGWVDSMIYFDGKDWKLMDPTFASTGKQSDSVKQYIGDGNNYQAQFVY